MQYRLTVNSPNFASYGKADAAIYADSRPYLAQSGAELRIQDEAGLLSVNGMDSSKIHDLLILFGRSGDVADHLADSLLDYRDPTDLKRLNGAASEGYIAAGELLPAHQLLSFSEEIYRVLGWRSLRTSDTMPPPDWLLTSAKRALNPNTAPLEVLAAYDAIPPELAKRIIDRRQVEAITGAADMVPLVAKPLESIWLSYGFQVSARVRLDIWPKEVRWGKRYYLEIAPGDGRERPIAIRGVRVLSPHDKKYYSHGETEHEIPIPTVTDSVRLPE
ncbi:general secretion pathway protein GspK [Burkholderiaceae bacterium DAT-1]|nr:general secretion pathway protein GspK [Burkholderiaceae bacterium DAT-1]